MADLRPRNMSQQEFADMLRDHGFPACSKAAVSLAERPKESGVQFTPEARNVAQGLLKSTRRSESRVNPNKTTVWLDDETRIWLEERAYMEDVSVGALIRKIIADAKKAASDAGTSGAAQREEKTAFPLPSKNNTKQEENQG